MTIPLYRDALAPVDKRVADLLSRMTIEEIEGIRTCKPSARRTNNG